MAVGSLVDNDIRSDAAAIAVDVVSDAADKVADEVANEPSDSEFVDDWASDAVHVVGCSAVCDGVVSSSA